MAAALQPQRSTPGMTRRDFVARAGGAAAALAGGRLSTAAHAGQPRTRPNIVLLVTDQQHLDSVAAGGCPHVRTPAMDRLMDQGVSFTQSYTANPVCSPARAAIFTGRCSSETGVYSNGKSIRSDIPNLGQWLSQETDYETIYAGKWHVPKGFTHFIPGFTVVNTGIGGQGNLGDISTSRACEGYLRNRSASSPFLLVASFLQPHDICEWLRLNRENVPELRYPQIADELPELPPNFEFDSREPASLKSTREKNEPSKGNWDQQHWRYYRWSYYRHVEMVDAEIGRVLQALDESGHADNTLVILTSDHGEGMAHHQMVRKSTPYDEASRVPLIVSWPGHVVHGRTDTTHLVSGLDLTPTLCDYAGVKPPASMRGRSLRSLLEGARTDWTPFLVSEARGDRCRMVRTAQYKYNAFKDDPVEQLFDMQTDPGETKNLAGDSAHAAALEEHRKLLREWEARLDVAPEVPNREYWRGL